jgi:hypothetical protein
MDPDKRQLRQLKRAVKRAGSKALRRRLKRDLSENPEDAAHSEIDYGRHSSETFNGMDKDATRKREELHHRGTEDTEKAKASEEES